MDDGLLERARKADKEIRELQERGKKLSEAEGNAIFEIIITAFVKEVGWAELIGMLFGIFKRGNSK